MNNRFARMSALSLLLALCASCATSGLAPQASPAQAAAITLLEQGKPREAAQQLEAQAFAATGAQRSRLLADAAFDAEEHHRYPREELGVRSTVIPLNRRGQGRKWPKTTYRRQMARRFRKKPTGSRHTRVYGPRWQAESAFSRHKRRLGSALGGRSDASREREGYLRVRTHNIMLLAAHE